MPFHKSHDIVLTRQRLAKHTIRALTENSTRLPQLKEAQVVVRACCGHHRAIRAPAEPADSIQVTLQ